MNNNCPNCRCYRKITNIKVSELVVSLIPENDKASPMEPFNFCIQTRYCSPQPTVPVGMILNEDEIPLWDIYGRQVYSDQIRCRTMYKARYVEESDTPHLTVLNLCLEGSMCPRLPEAAPKSSRPQKGSAPAKKDKE